jgi:CP family cyanate transporter-like MFS transporter
MRAAGHDHTSVATVVEQDVVGSASPITVSSAPRPLLPGWLAVTAVVLVAIDLRPGVVSIGPVLTLIRQDFGLDHARASLLTAIPDLIMGILALPTPWLARRFGRDRMLLIALALLCASMLGRAFVHGVGLLLLSTAGVGAGIAVAGSLVAGFIKANFASKAALFTGIYATALSFGSTISAASTGPISIAASSGWRFATGIWSALGLIAMIAWSIVTLEERKLRIEEREVVSKSRLPLRNRTAWMIALYFAVNNFLFYAMLAWTAPMFREYGFSPTTSGLLLASFTTAFMCGNPVFGALSKSHDRRGWLGACAVLTILGLIPLALAPSLAPFVWISLAAFGLGGGFTLGMTLPLDNANDVEEANVWNAFTLTVGYLIAAGGPLTVGILRDATGSFRLPLWILVVFAFIMLALTALLRPHKQVR